MAFNQKSLALAVVISFLMSVIAPCAFANPQSLNLSSTNANVPASSVVNSGVVHIHVGSGGLNVSPSSMLTPAEALAVSQILAGGRQTIQLGALGNAVGGRFLLGTTQSQTIADMLVPNKVTGILNFLNSSTLNINGALNDAGTIYAVSTNAATTSVAINAASINIASGGLLTTVVPSAGLAGISNPTPNVALTLNSSGSIVNAGTIRTAADLNLNSASGSYTNTGTIVSQNGNINIAMSQPNTDATFNNTGGTVQAANNINVRDAAYSGNANTTLSGGNWLSQQLNVNGGNGTVDVNVDKVTGQLNSTGEEEHVTASTPVLKLGNENVSGDPTYYNDGGDIDIDANLTPPENLAIIASGSVTSNGSAEIISNGYAVTVIAGAHISTAGCTGCSPSGTVSTGTPVPLGNTISISAGNGGDIHLNGVDSSSTTGNGGNITLVAFGNGGTTGNIFLGDNPINASGAGVGGNVTLIAGATGTPTSIATGPITTNGGNVTISNATPIYPGPAVTADAHGNLSTVFGTGTLQNAGSVVFGDINTSSTVGPGGSVTIQNAATAALTIGSTGNITNGVQQGNIIVSGIDSAHYGNITIINQGGAGSGGVVNNDNLVAANISITGLNFTTTGTLTANGTSLTTPNGVVTLAGYGDTGGMIINGTGSATQFSVSSATMSSITAGTLLLEDSYNFTLSGGEFSIGGSAGTAGAYNLTLIGSGTSGLIGTTQSYLNTLDIGSNNFSVVVPGNIAAGSGDGLFVRSFLSGNTTQNSGSVTLIAGGTIGNATGSLTFDLSGPQTGSDTGSGGNLTLVAGANNVTTASDGSSVQINASTGSGGNIIFGNNSAFSTHPFDAYQIDTYGGPRGGNGGNVTLVAFADSQGNNGQITVPNGTLAAVETGAIAGSVNSGNLTVVAGGLSTAGATINLGDINTSQYQGVGNIFIQTATPNAPVTLDLKGSTAGGAGAITSGTFVSSTPADGSIVVGNIGSSIVPAPAASVLTIILEAGSNSTSLYTGQGTSAVTVGSVTMPFSVTTNLFISTGIDGTSKGITADGLNITMGTVTLSGANSSVFLSSLDSIASGTITTGSAGRTGGPVMMIAGLENFDGNISVTSDSNSNSIVTNGGEVILASMGGVGAVNISGNINTSQTSGAGGSIAISTGSPQQSSTITIGGNINTSGTSGGDVLLTAYSNQSTEISVPRNINTSSSSSSGTLGQIWLLTVGGAGISIGTPTQNNYLGSKAANPVIPTDLTLSSGGANPVVFTPDGGTGTTVGNVTGFSPGGFNTIQDSSAVPINIQVSVSGANSVPDYNLVVPIISQGTFSLGANASSQISVPSGSDGTPLFALINQSSITLGNSTNPVPLTTNSQGSFIAFIGVLNGTVNINSNASDVLILPGTIVGNGAGAGLATASIQSSSQVIIPGPQIAFSNLSISTNAGLSFVAPIVSNGQISLGAGTTIQPSPGAVLLAPALLLTAGSTIGGATPIITNAAVIQGVSSDGSTDITALQSAHFDTNGSSVAALNLTEDLTNGVLKLGNTDAFVALSVSTAAGTNGSIVLAGTISGGALLEISADGSIIAQSGSSVVSPSITLTATNGNIGSASLPVAISNGGNGVSISSTSGGATYLADASSETVTLNSNSTPLSAGTIFSLTAVGDITDNLTAQTLDIVSPSVSLVTTTGVIQGSYNRDPALTISSPNGVSGTGTLGVTVFASAGGGFIVLGDLSFEPIVINNVSAPISSNYQVVISPRGSVSALAPELAISAQYISVNGNQGNIGTSASPLIVSSGTTGQLDLSVETVDSRANSGNVYVTVLGMDNGTTPAVSIYAVGAAAFPAQNPGSGNVVITVPNGGAQLTGAIGDGSVTVHVATNIEATGSIQSPQIDLIADTGNIGTNGAPITVGAGNAYAYPPGTLLQTTVRASAPGNTAGNGNIYIQDTDSDPSSSTPALILSTITAGSAGAPTSAGNVSVVATNGGIQVSGAITAINNATLSAQTNITASSGNISAASYNLTATTGGIGSLASPLQYYGGSGVTVTVTAGDSTNGKVYLQALTAATGTFPSPSVGNTFFLTADGPLNASLLNTFGSIPNIGLITTAGSGGSITVDANVTASASLTLSADGSITNAAGNTLSAPSISLTATNGNIGANGQEVLVSGNGSQLSLSATAPSGAAASGNVYIKDTDADGTNPALVLLNSSAGSGTQNSTGPNGQFIVTETNGSIVVSGNITATGAIQLSADKNITAISGSSAVAPDVELTATSGNIGTPSQPLNIGSSTTVGFTGGSVFLQTSNANLQFNTSNLTAQTFGLTATQAVSTDVLLPLAGVIPNVSLATLAGSGANITVGTHDLTVTSSLTLQADGSILPGTGTIAAPTMTLTATTGNIGGAGAVGVSSGNANTQLDLTANAIANTANNGNVYITDADSDVTSPSAADALAVTGTAGSGTAASNSGLFHVITTTGSIQTNGITASRSIVLNSSRDITGSGLLTASLVDLIAGGNVGGATPINVASGTGNGVQLAGSAHDTFFVGDTTTESLTISNGSGPITGTQVQIGALGNLLVSTPGSPAISSPTITVSALGGNITADGTATGGPFIINSGGTSGVTLSAGATGVVNIKDTSAETVTLGNSLSTLLGGVSFSLTAAGNIVPAAPGSTAITSPIITLTSTGGNITANGTATGGPLLVVSSNSPTGISIGTGNSTGVVNLQDNSEPVTLLSGSAGILQLTASGGVTISSGTTFNGSLALSTNSFVNSGTVYAPSGSILVASIGANNLSVSGTLGTITAGNGVIFTAAGTNDVNVSGTLTVNGNLTINALGGTVSASGTTINGGLTVNTDRYAPSGLTITGDVVLNFPASASSIGTIINTDGNVVLTKNTIINANGKNVAIVASGDVIANGATTINLSNKTGNGGNLIILAGYSFTPSTSGQVSVPDTSTDYGSPTVTTGGNVYLPKLTINTSSTAAAPNSTSAGNVFIVAAGGSDNAGTIDVGGITASSKNGQGGNVELIGQGGVIVNGAINTSGKTGGGSVSLVAAPPVLVGSLQVQDGYLTGGTIVASKTVADAGAAVLVTKTITTSSTNGPGGSVTIQADQQITAGNITTSGLSASAISGNAGGDVIVQSLGGFVSLGSVTTSAISPTTALAAGNAGLIDIDAGALITTGSLTAKGANFAGTGTAAGKGGTILLATASEVIDVPGGGTSVENIGQITVKGTINTAGGNGSTTKGGNGGNAGSVAIYAGAVSVTGVSAGNSITATAGTAGNNGGQAGTAGNVAIFTWANQTLPTNLNLTSSTRNIAALAGGMFSVGLGVSPNGVAGNIAADQVMSKTINSNGQILQGSAQNQVGKITVDVQGTNSAITENGANFPVNIVNGTKRTLLSPAEALALYQLERFGIQGISVNSIGTKGGTASGGPAQINELDISDQAFTSFNVPGAVSLQFNGSRVTLNLPSSAVAAGTMDFVGNDSVSYINVSGAKFNPGLISANGILILSGTGSTWTNNTTIGADELVIARPTTKALNFIGGTSSQLNVDTVMISPSAGPGLNVKFTDNSTNAYNPQVNLGVIPMPTTYIANVQAAAASTSKLPAVNLTFSQANGSGQVVSGAITASTISISGIANKVGSTTVQTSITLDDATFSASTTLSVTSTGSLTFSNNDLTAGTLVTSPSSPLAASNILTKGSLTLTGATGVTFYSNNIITNNGALLKITSTGTGSLLDLGSVNAFTDNGGNISILSKGNVQGEETTGENPNSFTAVGVLNTATGGIEIGAGTTTSMLSKALSSAPTTTLPAFPANTVNITPNANGSQVLLVPNGITGITLGTLATPATINFTNKGAIVLQAVGTSTINLQTSSFTTTSSKPISALDYDSDEVIVNADKDGSAI